MKFDFIEIENRLKGNIEIFMSYLVDKKDDGLGDDNKLLQQMIMKQAALMVLIREDELGEKIERTLEEEVNIQVLMSDIDVFNNLIEKRLKK
jgi:hypothetical protein